MNSSILVLSPITPLILSLPPLSLLLYPHRSQLNFSPPSHYYAELVVGSAVVIMCPMPTCVAVRFRVAAGAAAIAAERRGLRSGFTCRYFEALVILSGFSDSVLCCFFCFVLPREGGRERERGGSVLLLLLCSVLLRNPRSQISLDELAPARSTNYLSPRLPKLSCLNNYLYSRFTF